MTIRILTKMGKVAKKMMKVRMIIPLARRRRLLPPPPPPKKMNLIPKNHNIPMYTMRIYHPERRRKGRRRRRGRKRRKSIR